MKLAITQPNFIPWLGYFDLLDEVDIWLSLDNAQYVKQSVIVRNKIRKNENDFAWLTVNVQNTNLGTNINEVPMVKKHNWWEKHLNKLESYYRKAKCFNDFYPYFKEIIHPKTEDNDLAKYNERLVLSLCEYMGIDLEFKRSSELIPELKGEPQEKVLNLIDIISPDYYYNFSSGVDNGLYSKEPFHKRGIEFYKQNYIHPSYQQNYKKFLSHLSIVDLLMNQTPNDALSTIRGGRNWERFA